MAKSTNSLLFGFLIRPTICPLQLTLHLSIASNFSLDPAKLFLSARYALLHLPSLMHLGALLLGESLGFLYGLTPTYRSLRYLVDLPSLSTFNGELMRVKVQT
ncbi:hypothetical protein V2G26_013197 [Clonostachys chloroleuca]